MAADLLTAQWVVVVLSSLLLIIVAPKARQLSDFFQGSKNEKAPGLWLLAASLTISWLFAKSITNAANLGLEFGLVGGISYAVYYLSFVTAGVILYQMRTKGGIASIHQFLSDKFGRNALLLFSVLIGIRLMNEVWSNTMVIGSYFGDEGSTSYYASIVVFTLLTMAYALKGGLRSSLLTDGIQMVLFGVLLFVILGAILPDEIVTTSRVLNSGSWTLEGGLSLMIVAFLQIFSYPFHDPVMTDRGFIAPPKTTLYAFLIAGLAGALSIVLFSMVGIYGRFIPVTGQAPVEVAKLLGTTIMLAMNFIMITSAASTLDSTFNSFAKLWVIDLKACKPSIANGRWAIVGIVLLGSIPIFLGAEILSATTVSGTMVLGLAPVFLFWRQNAGPASFHLPVWFGILLGIVYAADLYAFDYFSGRYGDLLSVNLLGLAGVILLYFLPIILKNVATGRSGKY